MLRSKTKRRAQLNPRAKKRFARGVVSSWPLPNWVVFIVTLVTTIVAASYFLSEEGKAQLLMLASYIHTK
jgi:threonine/homoserine/homoserine lactone efflux protein